MGVTKKNQLFQWEIRSDEKRVAKNGVAKVGVAKTFLI